MKFKFLLFLLFLFPSSVQAIGVSISPSRLEILSSDIDKSYLVISNVSQEPILVSVFPDDFKQYIDINPNEFKLVPEEKIKVTIAVDFASQNIGVKKTDISVVSRALDRESFNAASGIKIPLAIYSSSGKFQWSGFLVFIAVFFGFLFVFGTARLAFWLLRPRQKKRVWQRVDFLQHYRRFRWPF